MPLVGRWRRWPVRPCCRASWLSTVRAQLWRWDLDGVSMSVKSLLRTDISLATSLDRLQASLGCAHAGAPLSCDQLRRELERHPTVFRVLLPRRGPWRAPIQRRREEHTSRAPLRSPAAPVVVPVESENQPPDTSSAGRLRRSVYWLGSTLDENSPRDIARWICLAHSCARTETRFG